MYPEVGCLEEILDLPGIRVEPRALDVDVWREDTVDDRSKGGGGHARVALLANGLVKVPGKNTRIFFKKKVSRMLRLNNMTNVACTVSSNSSSTSN